MKSKKSEKSEEQLVKDYVSRVIGGKVSRGHVDQRFDYTKKKSSVNKDMWIDYDFFFSVVFQSSEQKYQFLDFMREKFGIEVTQDDNCQIINGLKFAEKVGLKLKKESTKDFPYGDIELRPFILDDEDMTK